MSFPDLKVRNPSFTGSLFEGAWPSIAQLEERGTVKEILCDPEVTGSTPVRRTFCSAAIFRGDDAPSEGTRMEDRYGADASMSSPMGESQFHPRHPPMLPGELVSPPMSLYFGRIRPFSA